MNRVNHILHNPVFRAHIKRTERQEKDRKFCRHGLQHALDVARIAYIMVLEGQSGIDKEVVYAPALLHDIGKWVQLEKGIPHHLSSAEMAEELLDEAGFLPEEKAVITGAILLHRTKGQPEGTFDSVLYLADKRSRGCYDCKMQERCDWDSDKKNADIIV